MSSRNVNLRASISNWKFVECKLQQLPPSLYRSIQNFPELVETALERNILTNQEHAFIIAGGTRKWQLERLLQVVMTLKPEHRYKFALLIQETGNFQLIAICDTVFSPIEAFISDDANTKVLRLQAAVTCGDADVLNLLLPTENQLLWIPEINSGRTCLHAAVMGVNENQALSVLDLLLQSCRNSLHQCAEAAPGERPSNGEVNLLKKLVNHKDKDGNTVLHLAAKQGYVKVVKKFYFDYQVDVYVQNDLGVTPQEIIAVVCPEALYEMLDQTAVATVTVDLSSGNQNLEIDFSAIVSKSENLTNHRETHILCSSIRQQPKASKGLLRHVIVELFLELKWRKFKRWLYASVLLQILFLLLYTLFVVNVFIITCPTELSKANRAASMNREPEKVELKKPKCAKKSLKDYFFGTCSDSKPTPEAASGLQLRFFKIPTRCEFSEAWIALAWFFFIAGVVLLLMEVLKFCLSIMFYYKYDIHRKNSSKKVSSAVRAFHGIVGYLRGFRNFLNILNAVFLVITTQVATSHSVETLERRHYIYAAASIIFAWVLILIQGSEIYRFGLYILILEKVIKSFASMIMAYITLIIAMSIAFRLLFPGIHRFQTLPQALEGVIVLLTGEVDYYGSFDSEVPGSDGSHANTVSTESRLVYLAFAILICVIMLNVLLAFTLNDVKNFKRDSKVIWQMMLIEQLHYVEYLAIALNMAYQAVRKVVFPSLGKRNDDSVVPWDIYVVEPSKALKYGHVLSISMDSIPPSLRKQMKTFLQK